MKLIIIFAVLTSLSSIAFSKDNDYEKNVGFFIWDSSNRNDEEDFYRKNPTISKIIKKLNDNRDARNYNRHIIDNRLYGLSILEDIKTREKDGFILLSRHLFVKPVKIVAIYYTHGDYKLIDQWELKKHGLCISDLEVSKIVNLTKKKMKALKKGC